MATYLILNLVFMVIACILAGIKVSRPSKTTVFTLVTLLAMTAVFDNLIVGFSIVDYNPEKILGIRIGIAPIEDFAYAILAVILVPTIWSKLGKKHA